MGILRRGIAGQLQERICPEKEGGGSEKQGTRTRKSDQNESNGRLV